MTMAEELERFLQTYQESPMSWEKHDENCEGCKPVMIDAVTGKKMPPDSPEMMAVMGAWDRLNLIEKEAWHRVNCQNSHTPSDLRVVGNIAKQIEAALEKL